MVCEVPQNHFYHRSPLYDAPEWPSLNSDVCHGVGVSFVLIWHFQSTIKRKLKVHRCLAFEGDALAQAAQRRHPIEQPPDAGSHRRVDAFFYSRLEDCNLITREIAHRSQIKRDVVAVDFIEQAQRNTARLYDGAFS